MGHDTVQTEELLQNENNTLRMESESLLKVIELLSAQQINTCKINGNIDNFMKVKETSKNKKTKLNHQQDYRIHWGILLKLFPLKNAKTNRSLLMGTSRCYLHLIMLLIKEDRKSSQLNTINSQRLALLRNNMKNPSNRRKHV